MYVKEIQWLLCSIYKQSHIPFAVDAHLKLVEHFGNRLVREPSRIPEATLKHLRRKGRKMKEFVYERIPPSIPKSSWLRRYEKVRRVTKNVCKLDMKRVRLNKVAQHEKKYLLNCSVRV